MATITSAGGVLDVNDLVTRLVSAEAAQRAAPITRHEVATTTQISALGSLKGALSAFKTALDPLKTTDIFMARKATSADTDFFTVSADATASTGAYDVEVMALAKAHQLASSPFMAGSGAPIGDGTLTISVGGSSFDVEIAPDKNTLADVRDAINADADNTGVQATLLNTSTGTRLVLTSNKTGADHAIEVSASGGNGGLAQLAYDPEGAMTLTELTPAQNARLRLAASDDFTIESPTNVFEDAIDGVTITAKKVTAADEPVALEVAFDSAAVTANIQKFVTEYNKMQSTLAKLRSYNPETKVAGPLIGDSLLRGIEEQVRRGLSEPVAGVSGSYTTLASIGIKTTVSGSLELDTEKLTKAINADADAVASLFGSENGIAARLAGQLEKRLTTGGDVESRSTQLSTEMKSITKDKEALNLRLTQLESRYRKQFTALDSLLTQMQSTSSYLATQLASLPKVNR
jgi:flagellar hook-associated protein 2